MNSDNVATNVGEYANVNLVILAFGGHSLYCRRCVQPEEEGGIYLCDESIAGSGWSDGVAWVELIKKGPRVGMRRLCGKRELRALDRPRWLEDGYEEGDLLLLPNQHPLIARSPICSFELFVEESVPILTLKEIEDG